MSPRWRTRFWRSNTRGPHSLACRRQGSRTVTGGTHQHRNSPDTSWYAQALLPESYLVLNDGALGASERWGRSSGLQAGWRMERAELLPISSDIAPRAPPGPTSFRVADQRPTDQPVHRFQLCLPVSVVSVVEGLPVFLLRNQDSIR